MSQLNFWEHMNARKDIVHRLKMRERYCRSIEREAAEEIEFLRREVEFQRAEAEWAMNELIYLRQVALNYVKSVNEWRNGEEK